MKEKEDMKDIKNEKKKVKDSEVIDIEKLKEELKDDILKEIKNNKLLDEDIKKEEDKKKDEAKEDGEKNLEEKAKEKIEKLMDTVDETNSFDKKDISSNKGMALLSYLGPLCLIPFLLEKKSKFSEYHAKQGVNLFVIEIFFCLISYFLTSLIKIPNVCTLIGNTTITYDCGSVTPWFISLPLSFCKLFFSLISLVGIIYVFQGKAKELPLFGKIKIIK